MNILIAEDHLARREYLAALFKQGKERQITVVEDWREAWALLGDPKRWFAVALIDLNVPHISGLELFQRRRELPLHKSLAVVISTARNDRETITIMIKHGARHDLVKPVTEAAFKAKIQQIEEKRLAEAK